MTNSFLEVKFQDITPFDRNARVHTDVQISQIASSIREFGFTNPLLLDETKTIIAGHGRLAAARQIGMERLPAIIIPGLTDAQKAALRIADNKLALNASWDDDLLRSELMDLRDVGFDLALTGFGDVEWSDMLDEPAFDPVGPEDQGRLDEKAPVTCPECGHAFSPP